MAAPTMITASAEPAQIVRKEQSYQDYLAAVEENRRLSVEYIEGTIYMTPAPVPQHQRISRNLMFLLHGYVLSRNLGEVLTAPLDVELAPHARIVQPDIIFISHERVDALVSETQIIGAPDLVIEILSSGTARLDRIIKLTEYARAGVKEYWIVDPDEQAILIHILDGGAYRVAGALVSGDVIAVGQFSEAKIAVDAIFAF